ncbi:MAG TPA: ABC transporter permease [Geminicoccaceae bacterium]|nr:ABC transporter permease [Geminicoccus sp.]HMU48351.1 ABC transporter permease [Geminicoccaceae bacterium]
MSTAEPTRLGGAAAPASRPWLRRLLLSEYLVLALTVLYVALMAPIAPELLAAATWADILGAMMPLLIIAIGQTFVLIVAGIDLSATSVLAMSSVMAAAVMTLDGPLGGAAPAIVVTAGILTFMAVGGAIGAFNGACVTRLDMPPFIVTLTTMMFFSGAAIWVTTLLTDDGSSIGNLPRAFVFIGQGRVFGIPFSVLIAVVLGLLAHIVLSRTLYGRWLFAIGLNAHAAEVSGVPVRRVVFLAYVVSGLCAGLAAVIYTGRIETGTPVLGQRILLDVVGAAVIGGVSLFGGKGKIVWTVYGALFLTVIDKGLQLLGLSLASTFAVKGGVILAAAVLDAQRQRLAARG